MNKLDWGKLKVRYQENPVSRTKTGAKFRVTRVTEEAVFIDLPSKEEYISRENLEKAAEYISVGGIIKGPADYRKKIYDQRPAYACAYSDDSGHPFRTKAATCRSGATLGMTYVPEWPD